MTQWLIVGVLVKRHLKHPTAERADRGLAQRSQRRDPQALCRTRYGLLRSFLTMCRFA